jgi:hypothetical protein
MSEEKTQPKPEQSLFDKILETIMNYCQDKKMHLAQINFEVELVQRHLWKQFDNQVASRAAEQIASGDKQEQEVSSPEVVEDKA